MPLPLLLAQQSLMPGPRGGWVGVGRAARGALPLRIKTVGEQAEAEPQRRQHDVVEVTGQSREAEGAKRDDRNGRRAADCRNDGTGRAGLDESRVVHRDFGAATEASLVG